MFYPSIAEPVRSRTKSMQGYLFADKPAEQAYNNAPDQASVRTFSNDEVANTLLYLPEAARLGTVEAFRGFLRDHLPYNSESTRTRRANNIINRFFPDGDVNTPLTYYSAHCAASEDIKPAVFYHILKAEPLAARFAEELVWPTVPLGVLYRQAIHDFVMHWLPEASQSSAQKMLQALFHTYDLLDVAQADGNAALRFQMRTGTLTGFTYVLTAEYPDPGIYTFESLESGPLRTWLLWDREWMRRQLYNLHDMGIVSKISEIDTVRQFSLAADQRSLLRVYFGDLQSESMARE